MTHDYTGFCCDFPPDERLSSLPPTPPRHRSRGAAMSPAETLLAVQLEQAHIPFVREYAFARPRRWRADFAIVRPDYGEHLDLLIEVDGGGFTGGHRRFGRMDDECEKGNAAALMGFRVLHFTPAMVENGRALTVIRQALGLEAAA